MGRRFGRDHFDVPEIRGAPARPASFENDRPRHQRRLGGDAKIRDWLDSPAPRPGSGDNDHDIRGPMRYRRKDGEDKQLEADFGQTIAEDFLDQAAVDAATLFAHPEVVDRLNSADTMVPGIVVRAVPATRVRHFRAL